jgi:hypothetical protein
MNNVTCLYTDREAVLVAYLYDDLEPAARVAFDTHVTTCLPCRSELAGMRGVRSRLAEWVPPEPSRAFSFESPIPNPQSQRPAAWWHTVPVWAQVAAAMLVLGVSASIANLDIRYDRNSGLNVRTGWSRSAAAAVAAAGTPADSAPWRAELAALRTELRSQMRAQSTPVTAAAVAPAAGGAMSEAEFSRRARVLLDESEKRQQKELAVRLVQLQTDFNALLQSDRIRTNQLFRDVTNTYGTQIQNQQRQINYLQPVQGR